MQLTPRIIPGLSLESKSKSSALLRAGVFPDLNSALPDPWCLGDGVTLDDSVEAANSVIRRSPSRPRPVVFFLFVLKKIFLFFLSFGQGCLLYLAWRVERMRSSPSASIIYFPYARPAPNGLSSLASAKACSSVRLNLPVFAS